MELSAQRLHKLAIEAFRIGNRGRLSLCEVLRVLGETRLHFDLGFPSLPAYADACFQLRRAETFEYARVARALLELTELREAFGRGWIGWSALKAITRVATAGTQSTWIEFARKNGIERTLAEATDALRRRSDAPRDSSFGLPNLDQKLVLRFPRSDMDRVRSWIEEASATVAANTGAEVVTLEQAILFLCERDMASGTRAGRPATYPGTMPDAEARSGGGTEEDPPSPARPTTVEARAQIVYQSCPDCRKARVGTRDGFVEVAPEEVARFESSADTVVIDGPTPPRLRRRVLGREAGRCGNPRCHHRAEHCHHIVFRSRGGETTMENEVAVCTTCHALIHAGLLRVSGDANDALTWSPVSSVPGTGRDLAAEGAGADRLPVLEVAWVAAGSPEGAEDSAESAIADSAQDVPRRGALDSHRNFMPGAGCTLDLEALAQGLTRLGVSPPRSRQIIAAAVAALPPGLSTEAGVLRRALASI